MVDVVETPPQLCTRSPWQRHGIMAKLAPCIQGLRETCLDSSTRYMLGYGCMLYALYLLYAPSQTWGQRMQMAGLALHPFCTEQINTAIESSFDRIGTRYNRMTQRGKDVAASASLLSVFIVTLCFVGACFA